MNAKTHSRKPIAQGRGEIEGAGHLALRRLFMAPTVVENADPSMAIAREEVFGPVVAALVFKTVPGAIESANSTSYGVSASVRSRGVDTAIGVWDGVCGPAPSGSTLCMDGTPELHFGGYHQSGVGRELGRNAGKDYTEEKTFHVRRCRRTSWLLTRAA